MREILNDLIRELEAGRDAALVTVVKSAGSTPRGTGARMLVRSDGTMAGTIGGGALEAFIYRTALKSLAARATTLASFNLNPNDANSLGMICGGDGQVLIEFIDGSAPRWLRACKFVAESARQGTPAWMVSRLPSQPMENFAAALCVVQRDGTIGPLAGTAFDEPETLAKLATESNFFRVDERLGAVIDRVGYNGTAFVFGAGHVARSLVPVLASVGFRTVVLDDRREFVQRERFTQADELVLLDSFAIPFAGLSIDASSYIIIVTRGHMLDKSVIKQSLATSACYIGAIGSRRKLQLTFEALRAEGITNEQLERVHAPIGLDIGAESPAEIAVSIAAELIKVRSESSAANAPA